MKCNLVLIILIILSFFIMQPLFSQDESSKNEASKTEKDIEDVYLQNPELMIVEKQVYTGDRYTQLEALAGIEAFLNDIRPGDSQKDDPLQPIDPADIPPQIEEMLIHLASQGSLIVTKQGNTVVNDFPEVRRKACELLGWVRTEDSKIYLIKFVKEDSEPMVKAEAAWALGEYAKYSGDKDGEITRALARVIDREKIDNPDNNLAYAVVLSFEKISEKHNGGLPHPDGYIALIKIAQGNYINTVTNKALEVIQNLRKKK
ncbi:MAG: HEAT repeat domain-containing protein [Spirochaetales bacterium]|nr:HEAT repeat domain-containing protein [Spirochaetales bacterium]